MPNSRRAARIVAEWRRRCEAGAGEPSEELLRGHPEIAEDLRTQLELQQSLGQMADEGPPEPASPRAPLRETIGDFRIVREIGRGGMGVVYEARQESMRRTVALKVLSPTVTLNPKAVERFRREAQAAGSLHHTNIVAVHAMGEDAGIWYYAMERIRGRTLAEVIVDLKRLQGSAPHEPAPGTPSSWVTSGGSGRAHYARVASAFAGLADALDHAHAGGILHRDVKPSNVMLDADGTLKLTDFGLARVDDDTAGLTLTGDVLGTPAYMSPEQLRPGTTPVDGRTDVYSLGATLYEFLALRSPFEARSPRELLSGILTRHAESTRRSNTAIPRDLDTIVLKALERDPAKRYRTAGEMGHDLLRFAEGVPIQARRASSVVRLWRRVRKHRRTVASIGATALAGVVVFWALASTRVERERRTELEYDQAVHQAMASLLEHGWFAEGRLWRLPPHHNEDILATLKRLADAHPHRHEARLLAVLLPETPLERQLSDLDDGRSTGLDERAWRLARAYALFRAARFGEAVEEHAAAGRAPPAQDRLTALFECYALACEGNRVEAIAGLDRLLDGESTLHHALALEARAFSREQLGDVTGALEDYSALETHLGSFRLAIRVRMAGLWLGLEQDEKAKAIFDEGLATVRKSHDGDANRFAQLVDGCWPWMPVEWHDRATLAAVEDLPTSSRAWALRAASLSRRKNADRAGAVDAGQRALVGASGPARKALLVDLAEMLLGAGRAPEALESCEQALAIDASSSSALASKVWILWALGQKEESLALARRTAEREPSHLPLRALAYTLARSNQIEEALATCARALKAEPRSADCHLLKINILRNLRRWDEVETACRAALARNGNNIIVLHRLCEAYDSLNRWVDYLSIAQRLTKLEPEVSLNWANLANALSELDRPADALPAIRHAMEVGPPHVNHYRVAATVLHQLRRTDEAVLEFEKCIANGDAPPAVWREAASMLLSVDRPKDALAIADRGLVHFESDVHILHQRAVALFELGEKERSLEAFRREIKLDPTQSQAWSNAALCEDQLGRTEIALATAREGLEKTGARNVRSMLGAILLEHDRTAEAREALAPLCAVPQDLDAMAHQVSALTAVGTLEEAIACVEGVRSRWGVAQGARWARPVVGGWRGKRKREADAEALAQRVSQWPGLDGYEGAYLMAIAGAKVESARLAASLPPPADAARAYDRARLYALLGRREDALAGLNQVAREGRKAPLAAEDPDLAAYREDPEFLAVFERLR